MTRKEFSLYFEYKAIEVEHVEDKGSEHHYEFYLKIPTGLQWSSRKANFDLIDRGFVEVDGNARGIHFTPQASSAGITEESPCLS